MSKKPYVIINMAMSADGKITTKNRERFSLGSAEDRRLMDVLRARADAVIIGATTLRLDRWAIRVRNDDVREKRIARRGTPHPLNVVMTTRLDIPARGQFFEHPETEKLVITTRQASLRRVARWRKAAEVIVFPKKRLSPADVLDVLAERGIRRVLVEGGGTLNFSFFKAGLVDELYVTVTPRIIGGESAPTPVDGAGFLKSKVQRLELVSSRRRGDEVFLRYKVKR